MCRTDAAASIATRTTYRDVGETSLLAARAGVHILPICGIVKRISDYWNRGRGNRFEILVNFDFWRQRRGVLDRSAGRTREPFILAERLHLPAVYPYRFFAETGGLMSYGDDGLELPRRAASHVDQILRGKRPADIPVLNLKTAKQLGLVVPQTLLVAADRIIE